MKRDEEGSVLIISMVVMMLLSTLALAGLARALSVMNVARHGQSFDSAHAVADAALHDAVYRLDYGLESALGWTVGTTEVIPGDSTKTYRYKVVRLSDDEYQVDAIGTMGSTNHAVRAVLKRGAGLALFSDDPLTVGASGSDGVLGLSLSSVVDVALPGAVQPTHIGSNSEISILSGGATGDVQHTFVGSSGTGRCTGCSNHVQHQRTYPMKEVVAPPTATAADEARCNALSGNFTGIIDGGGGQPFICRRDVKVGYFTLVNGPLVIYVLPTINADGTESHNELDISGAPINLNGRAADLRIYKAGSEPVKLNDLSLALPTLGVSVLGVPLVRTPGVLYLGDVSFTGLLYAPETVLRINANQWWKGAILAKRIEATGSPLVTLTYDQGLQRFANDWSITNYAQIPTSEAVVA